MLQEFTRVFKPRLTVPKYGPTQFNRWPGFEFIAKELFALNRPVHIVETGTTCKDNDWLGYGHATLMFDWILSKTGGVGNSVDINPVACKFSRSKCTHMRVTNCDSIGFLRGYSMPEKIDLLYLDSYDWSPDLHVRSSLHHMGELAAIYERLPVGCLIAVDDCHSDKDGKHVMVNLFFKHFLQQEPLVKCHMQIWKKVKA